MLVTYFPDILSYSFTADLEDQLDHVAQGRDEWCPFLA
jgi:DNA topoisomerase IA